MRAGADEKSSLRRQLRQRWLASPLPGAVAGQLLQHIVDVCSSAHPRAAVAGFIRHGHEVDVEPLLAELKVSGVTVALPKVEGDDLLFLRWDAAELIEGAYGLLEPLNAGAVSLAELAVVLVPAMACSVDGTRLGRGGGYYDRALSKLPASARLICVVGDDAVMPAGSIPQEPHDVRMHAIATPTRLLEVADLQAN